MQSSRRERVYNNYPEPITGYQLNAEHGLFSVIIPEATTNLVTNPSINGGVTTGYTAQGGAMAATTDWQAYGAYSLKLTPAVSTESGFYYGTFATTATFAYTASITIQGEAGKLYYIYFGTTAGAVLGTKREWRGTGHKQRIHVTWTDLAGGTRRVYVTRAGQYTDQNIFYADGLQVEHSAHPTTYCDGDQVGFLVNENPAPYLWTGTPHASTSTRSSQTRSGGREMNFLDLGLKVLTIIGLGMSPLVDQALSIPGFGELPQGTGTMAREFTLVTSLEADGQRHLQAQLATIEDAFKPDLIVKDQPMVLRYQLYDEDDPCGDQVDIVCKYRSGLEGNDDNNHQNRLALNFKMYFPYIKSSFQNGGTLGFQTTVANANYILMRTAAGVWQEMVGGANDFVLALALAKDGGVLVGGDFLNLGDANGDKISKWIGSAWSSLLNGIPAGEVAAFAVDADGNVYVGGTFTNLGDANGDNIAMWDGSAWHSLGTGMNDSVGALAIGPDGALYAGGVFTLAGGVANTTRIAKWYGGVWTPLSTGANAYVTSLAFDGHGDLYVGGSFTVIGGVTCNRIAKWDGSNFSSLANGLDGQVRKILSSPDGIYIGGDFTVAAGSAPGSFLIVNYIVKWNGSYWIALGKGMNDNVYSLARDGNGALYVGGQFTLAGNVPVPDSIALWTGTAWIPIDVDLPGSSPVYDLLFDASYNLYVAFGQTGSATSATITVPNVGSAKVYPIVRFIGPGTLWQLKDYSTGKAMFFNLTLLAGETAILNLDPMHISFQSSFRGNLLPTILPGSDLDFPLLPGNNNLSAYMFGSTSAATAITVTWNPLLWSLEGAAWK